MSLLQERRLEHVFLFYFLFSHVSLCTVALVSLLQSVLHLGGQKDLRYLENRPAVSSAKPDMLRPARESHAELLCAVSKYSVGELGIK